MFPTAVVLFACALVLHASDAACPSEGPTKQLLCYVEQISAQFDPCLCTHLVLQTPLDKLSPTSELLKKAQRLQENNPALKLIAVASDLAETALKRRDSYAKSVSNVVEKCGLDGVEIDLQWGAKVAGKVQLVDLVQSISKEFKSLEPNARTKRDYKIYEQSNDDVTTEQWTPPKSKSKSRKTRSSNDDKESTKETKEHHVVKKETEQENHVDIILRLTSEPQHLAKNFDLKRLSKYVDLYTIASDNLTDASEHGVTYHPSRLMGIQDILNADSLIDLLTGLGAPHEKLVLTLPARALKFTLQDAKKNLPQSPVSGEAKYITQSELCATMSEGNWTVERDEDLTAPYAFHDNTWIAFDDSISASIKGKYILLRDLAGGAVMAADAEDWSGKCNATKTAVLTTLYNTFTNIARKSRAAQLISLQEELHESAQYSYSGDIHLSPYRIVRVVDRAGSIHVVRKEAKTEFECSRQGYFTHPSGCNRFYRCVKFNQYTPDFTVFEYDCPAGLAFDERYEVCVWPGSLPDGGACQGSSEIAPVPRSRYVCPRVEGYYADPENCRWFFACLDHVRDGATPLTAYEFRCPFGLVFNEKALVCDWPWLVEGCGGIGTFRATFSVGDFYEGRHRASYASLSDVHVSGGRIDNVPGGVVLGSSVVGGLASGSNIHSSGAGGFSGGAYAAKGYSGGAYDYSGLAGGLHDGGLYVAGGHSGENAGLYSAGGSSSGGLYLGGALGHSGAKIAVTGAKGASGYAGQYEGGNGVYGGAAGGYSSTFSSSGAKGSAGYSGGIGHAGGAYVGASGGSYEAGKYAGAGAAGVTPGVVYTTVGAGGSAGYSSETGNAGGAYVGASGGSYEAGKYAGAGAAGVVYTNVGAGGSAGYSSETGNVGGAYVGASGGSYEAGKYAGASAAGVVYTNVGAGGSAGYSSETGNVGGAYVGASGGSYEAGKYAVAGAAGVTPGVVYTTVGAGGSAGYSGEIRNAGGAYEGTIGGSYEAGKYVGLGAGVSSGVVYSGDHEEHAGGAGQYSGASNGAYSSSSSVSKTGAPSYKVGGGYSGFDEHLSIYNGGFGQKSAPVTLVSDAISSGYNQDLSGINVLTEQKPINFVNFQSVKVTPGSDVVSGFGVNHFNTVPLVTPSPLPAVSVSPVSISSYGSPIIKTVTQSPISISSYKAPIVYQPTTPRPTTYYQSPALAVTSVPVTYQRPLVSVTPRVTPLSVTPSPLPAVHVQTYEQPLIKTVTPTPVPAYRVPTVLKTTVVPLNPIQYSTPAPFLVGYSSPGPLHLSSPSPIEPIHISTPAPLPAVSSVHISYPKPEIGILKSPEVPYSPVSYTFKQPVSSIHLSTPAPALIKTVTEAPVVYREEYTYQKPLFPIKPALSIQPVQKIQPVLPVHPVEPFQKIQPVVPVQRVQPVLPVQKIQPVLPVHPVEPFQKIQPVVPVQRVQPVLPVQPVQPVQPIVPLQQPQAPAVSYTYTYNRPGLKVPLAVTPSPVAVEYSPSPATIIKPLEVKYSYPRPAVLKTPFVPLNPIQYSTPAPVAIDYTPTPTTFVKPLEVKYAYPRPAVLKEPVVPLNPIQYSTPAPINFQYSTPVTSYSQSEITVEQNLPVAPVQPVNFVKAIPRPAFRAPIQYSTPTPIAVEYPTLKPIPFRPAVLKTPVVPLNPVQYTTSAPVFFEHSTPAPLKPVGYVQPNIPFAPISSVKFGTGYKLPAITQQPISIDYSYQQPIKSPVTPVSIEYSSVTPAPAVQQVHVSYNYPKPAVKLVEQPVVVSTVAPPAPTVPMYQRVINAFKAPVFTAYQKVLNTITGSTPSTLIQPVTQSPVSYAPVDVGFSYKRPALVKTQSIPVTPVNVVPAYQKVLNVIKASTTPAPLYANHYTSTYETPQVVVSTPKPIAVQPTVISESSFGLDFANHGFEGNTDEFYEAVRQDFGSRFVSDSHTKGFGGYEYQRPAVKFTEGVSFVQQKPDVSYYSSTTQAPVIKQTFRKPVKTFVEYVQPAYNVEFESGKISGYQEQSVIGGAEYGGLSYSQVPVVKTTLPVVKQPVQVEQEYSSGHVGVVYDGSVGYSQLPVVTSTTPAPTVDITTARVSLPVVTTSAPTVDAYYTRRKQSRLRPVVVTTETYPTSTSTPLAIFSSTHSYPTTPVATYSSSAAYEGEELEVEGEEEDDSAKLLEQYNGQFGGVLTKGVSVSGYSGESSTVANIKDGEAIVGVLKKGRVDYTGRKTKSKVVVVSRLSDFNPILVGKLGAECSCRPKSNTLSLRRGNTKLFTPSLVDLPQIPDQILTDSYVTSTTTLSPEAVVGDEFGASFYSEKQLDISPIVEIKPLVGKKAVFSTTVAPILADYSLSAGEVAPTVYQAPIVKLPKLGKSLKSVAYAGNSLRNTYQDVLLQNTASDIADFADAGKSFDRYGPGGLRGVDEILQGSVDCKRAGLFRHPKYCNKFYACNWDEWKGRFTLHVFNCPVHLAYDSALGACNWPSKGPACADDNLLV